ncbi:hypothetical protein VTN02DRAFT_6043 [Thermoascus thermophilus]
MTEKHRGRPTTCAVTGPWLWLFMEGAVESPRGTCDCRLGALRARPRKTRRPDAPSGKAPYRPPFRPRARLSGRHPRRLVRCISADDDSNAVPDKTSSFFSPSSPVISTVLCLPEPPGDRHPQASRSTEGIERRPHARPLPSSSPDSRTVAPPSIPESPSAATGLLDHFVA